MFHSLIMPTMLVGMAFALIATPIMAQSNFQSRELFRRGAWTVNLTHDVEEGNLWCSAETRNQRNQTFSLTVFDVGQLTIFVFDPEWDILRRPVRFLIDIDRRGWTLDGTGERSGVSITPSDPDVSYRFLSQVMRGNAVTVSNADGRRLANFSLNGSFAAVNNLFECFQLIRVDSGNSRDPFTSRSDPF